MSQNLVTAFEASRLSAVGLGMLLLLMCAARVAHFFIWRQKFQPIGVPFVEYGAEFASLPSIRKADGVWTVIVATLIALIPIFAFVPAILQTYVEWLSGRAFPGFALVSCWLLILLITHYLWKLAFNPTRKVIWVTCWIIFAHIVAFMG